jgi:hypothetical protein
MEKVCLLKKDKHVLFLYFEHTHTHTQTHYTFREVKIIRGKQSFLSSQFFFSSSLPYNNMISVIKHEMINVFLAASGSFYLELKILFSNLLFLVGFAVVVVVLFFPVSIARLSC